MTPTAPKLGVRKTYNTGYYRSSGQGFRAGSESGVVYHVPGVSGTVCRGIQGSWMQGGRGPIRVGGVIFERRSPSCRRWHTALLFESFKRRSRGFVAAGVALGRSGVAQPAGRRRRGSGV